MLFVGFVRADYPACATSCVGVYSAGSCSYSDNNCMCQNASYCNNTNNCFRTSCSYNDWVTAYDYSVSLCNEAGVTQNNILNPPHKRSVAPAAKREFVPVYVRSRA